MTDLTDFDGLTSSPDSSSTTVAESLIAHAADDIAEIGRSQLRTVYLAIRAGLRLIAGKNECPHGEFGSLLAKLGIHERMARNYMKLALKMRDALELKPNEIQILLSAQPRLTEKGQVTIDTRPSLAKRMAKWIDNRTLTELMQDLGIRTRELPKPTPPPAGGQDDDGDETGKLCRIDTVRTAWFGSEGKGGLLTDLNTWGLQEKSFVHLKVEERRAVLDILIDLTKSIKATL